MPLDVLQARVCLSDDQTWLQEELEGGAERDSRRMGREELTGVRNVQKEPQGIQQHEQKGGAERDSRRMGREELTGVQNVQKEPQGIQKHVQKGGAGIQNVQKEQQGNRFTDFCSSMLPSSPCDVSNSRRPVNLNARRTISAYKEGSKDNAGSPEHAVPASSLPQEQQGLAPGHDPGVARSHLSAP